MGHPSYDKLVLRREAVNQQTRTGTYGSGSTYSQYRCKNIVQVNRLYSVNGTTQGQVFIIILGKLGSS